MKLLGALITACMFMLAAWFCYQTGLYNLAFPIHPVSTSSIYIEDKQFQTFIVVMFGASLSAGVFLLFRIAEYKRRSE
ncbi:hypothetical protein Q7A53_06485 [Halobacillus rhizosphaerae]|uniref:hypothetical protein n=1 Tax=Halobacillus rhizosphaerae TaxID=3064889 RepID=UPI00398B6A89